MQQNKCFDKNLIFISGGVRSGKSSFAEQLAISYVKENNKPLYYIATSKADDIEMKERILRHQQNRLLSGLVWETIEISENFVTEVVDLQIEGVVLLDCLTVLTANELFIERIEESELAETSAKVFNDIISGLSSLLKKISTLIVVSNEIHYEWIDDIYVQTYQRLLGQLHQTLVKRSTTSYVVESNIPIMMKGTEQLSKIERVD